MNGQTIVSPVEENSSPSRITATKGSSVWLHWNYTYIGDGSHVSGVLTATYSEQIVGFNSTALYTIQTLAKRSGENGALSLESSIPAPFNGRVNVLSSNSTLVIHRLQYNDSNYQFSSTVNVILQPTGGGPSTSPFSLKPTISMTVNGMHVYLCLI